MSEDAVELNLATEEVKLWKDFHRKVSKQNEFTDLFSLTLWRKGINSTDLLAELLSEDIKSLTASFRELPGATEAAQLIKQILDQKLPVVIYGDYDVDGVSSTSLLWRFFYRTLELQTKPIIPLRTKEGYGLNLAKCQEACDSMPEGGLLIAVDCGIRDVDLIAQLKKQFPKVKILIADHHTLSEDGRIPQADVIVHPLLPGSKIEPKAICATAVAWNIICSTRELLSIPQDFSGLELVALATVCDLMPLTGWNRLAVKAGLKEFANTRLLGIRALAQTAGVDLASIQSFHLGFVLGPRINAVGRLGDALEAVRILCTDSINTAQKLAFNLNEQNKLRQQLTLEASLFALTFREKLIDGKRVHIDENGLATDKLTIVFNPQWEEGIVGLVAGRLNEQTGLPAIALTTNENGELVGSARSPKNIDITTAIASQKDKLIRYGGHGQAAGLTLAMTNLTGFIKGLNNYFRKLQMHSDPMLTLDPGRLKLRLPWLSMQFAKELTLLEPFGYENEEPVFQFPEVDLHSYRSLSQNRHLSFLNNDFPLGEFIWFNHSLDVQRELAKLPLKLNLSGNIGINTWQGRSKLQIRINEWNLLN